MKYTNKWMVIPFVPQSSSEPKVTLSTQKTLTTDKKIDKDLTSIIKNKKISPDQRVKLYNQMLLKNVNLMSTHSNQLPPTVVYTKVEESKENEDFSEDLNANG